MKTSYRSTAALAMLACSASSVSAQTPTRGLDEIETIVVIYAENRGFDHLYGRFPAPTASPT